MRHPTSKAGRDERRKLRATSLNAIALALLAVGVIQPIFVGRFEAYVPVRMAFSGLFAYGLHELAALLLRGLED